MRQMVRWEQVRANGQPGLETGGGFDEEGRLLGLGGYVLEELTATAPQSMVSVWGCTLIITNPFGESQIARDLPNRPTFNATHPKRLQLRAVGRLLPVEATQAEPRALPTVRTLRPVRSGQAYRITSPPARGVVTPELAEALEAVSERFARERGFTPDKPLDIRLSRGFKAGSHGHGEGRAADIVALGGKSLLEWKQEWDQATATAEKLSDPQKQAEAIAAEEKGNLGYGLYKVLQNHGGWRVDPKSWRPYRGVMQLFGPWTPTEGPWKAMQIKDPNPYQRQRLADQQWVFQAHQDHIHVAR
jgi:hypothetical protein